MIEINFGLSAYVRHKTNIYGSEAIKYGISLKDNKVEIPEKGEISALDPQEFGISDYQGFEKIKPERAEANKWFPPAVDITREEEFNYFETREIILFWIEPRGEWVGVYHRRWPEAGGLDDEFATGPFVLDEMCSRKILQAYGLTEGRFRPEEVKQMSPEKLEASI